MRWVLETVGIVLVSIVSALPLIFYAILGASLGSSILFGIGLLIGGVYLLVMRWYLDGGGYHD